MPRKNWILTTPRRGFTHVQITALKIEYERSNCDPPTAGYVDVWWTYGEIVAGVYTDEDSRAWDYRVTGAEYTALDALIFPVMTSLIDIENRVYAFLGTRGIIPPGTLVDR